MLVEEMDGSGSISELGMGNIKMEPPDEPDDELIEPQVEVFEQPPTLTSVVFEDSLKSESNVPEPQEVGLVAVKTEPIEYSEENEDQQDSGLKSEVESCSDNGWMATDADGIQNSTDTRSVHNCEDENAYNEEVHANLYKSTQEDSNNQPKIATLEKASANYPKPPIRKNSAKEKSPEELWSFEDSMKILGRNCRKQDRLNEFDIFCRSLAVQLKKMPRERALICQERLRSVMVGEHLRELQLVSSVSNNLDASTRMNPT